MLFLKRLLIGTHRLHADKYSTQERSHRGKESPTFVSASRFFKIVARVSFEQPPPRCVGTFFLSLANQQKQLFPLSLRQITRLLFW